MDDYMGYIPISPHKSLLPQILEMISCIPQRCDSIDNVLRYIQRQLSENDRETIGDRLEDVVYQCLNTGERLGLLNVANDQIRLPFKIRSNNIPDYTLNMVEDEPINPEDVAMARKFQALMRSSSETKSESSEEIKPPEQKRYRPQEKKPLRGRGGRDGRGERNRHGGVEGHGGDRREPDAKRGRSGSRATSRPIVQPNPSSSSSLEENVKRNRKHDNKKNNRGRSLPQNDFSPQWDVRTPLQRGRPAPRANLRTNRTCRKRRAPIRRAKRPIAARKLARRRQAARKAKARNCRRRR